MVPLMIKMEKKKDLRKVVHLQPKTMDKVRFMSSLVNDGKISDFVTEIMDRLFELLFTFKTIDSIEYESSLSNQLTITCYGSKRIFTDSIAMPEDATDTEIFEAVKKRLGK